MPPPPVHRYEREHPGELLHFDIKKLARIVRPGHGVTGDRQHDQVRGAGWAYLHIAIDDYSRISFAQILPDESAHSVIAFLHAALAFFKKLGVSIYSDNGPAYRSRALASQVASLGLKHRFTRFYTPKTNGKAERFIQTSLREGPTPTPTRTPLNAQSVSSSSSTITTSTALTTPSSSSPLSHAFACH